MSDRATLEHLVARAVRAPSSHNTQPWLFRPRAAGVALLADRRRALPVNDPEDRELTISCGCALLTLRAAAAEAGIATRVTPFPEPEDEDVLADVALEDGPAQAALAPAIEARHTHRKRFEDAPVAKTTLHALADAAEAEGARLDLLEGETTRAEAAALVAEGDRAQWDDPRWRRELAAWMHPRRRGDGLTLPGLAVPVAQLVVRSFDMGGGVAARDREIAAHSPVMALISTPDDGPGDWLAVGQALQRVLLAAAVEGVQASYLNQPIQVAALRPRLGRLAGVLGAPQILLRLGYPAEAPSPAPRRPVAEVIED